MSKEEDKAFGATHYATPMGKTIFIKDTLFGRKYWNDNRKMWMIFNFHSLSIKPL